MKNRYLLISSALLIISFSIVLLMAKQKGYNVRMRGKLVVVNKGSSSVTIFDLEKGKQQASIFIDVEPHEITNLIGDLVVISNYGNEKKRGNSLTVINTVTSKVERTINLADNLMPHGIVAVPHTNNVIVVTEQNAAILIVNAMSGMIEKRVLTNQKQTHMVAIHPDYKIAYASNKGSGSISVINIEKGELLQNIVCGKGAVGVDVTPDGKEIWVSNGIDNTVTVIASAGNNILATLKCNEEPNRLKISPDGKYCLVVNSKGGNICVFDVKSKALTHTITVPGKSNMVERIFLHTPVLTGIQFHPDGKYVFIANSNANKIVVVDTENWDIVSNIATGNIPDGMAVINAEKKPI